MLAVSMMLGFLVSDTGGGYAIVCTRFDQNQTASQRKSAAGQACVPFHEVDFLRCGLSRHTRLYYSITMVLIISGDLVKHHILSKGILSCTVIHIMMFHSFAFCMKKNT